MTDVAVQSGGGVGGGGWPHELDVEYDCLGELGRGGMAVVYRAKERALGREVAVKVVRPRFHTDSESVARLAREARTVAQLEHPNIVSLHAVKPLTNGLALVMQLVPGRTLKEALARGPLSPSEAELVLRDIARALAYAHRCGVVHRDVKPENIFLDEITGRALLSDFGVARSIEENTELTATGTAIGTPTYMSPEQIDGGHLDGRSDLYSLGMVGWEMLSGQRPWAGESLYSVIYRQKHDPLPPLDFLRNDIPARLQYLIEGLMHKNPDRRWASAARFLTLLSGDDNVPGLKEWVAAAKKRRRSGAYRPVTPSRNASLSPSANQAMSTVKFRRDEEGATAEAGIPSPDELQAIPIGDADATQRLARSPAWGAPAVHPPDELEPAPRSRTLWYVGGAVTVVALAAVAFVARQRQSDATRVLPDSARLADAAQVVVPVLPPTDSTSLLASAPPESVALASGTVPPADSLQLRPGGNVDSLRALAAAELSGRSTPSAIPARPPAGSSTVMPGGAPLPPGARPNTTATSAGSIAAPARDSAPRAPIVAVSFPADRGAIAAGGRHSCMLDDAGKARCWGNNERGQLGDGSFDAHAEPAAIVGDFTLTSITAGVWHSCGVAREGEVYCWGSNDAGQLGDGTTAARATPVQVATDQRFVSIAAGNQHTCAVSTAGTVWCWGRNNFGQLGNGSTADATTPQSVDAAISFATVTAGQLHSCARARDGRAFCWGRNTYGQLGDGSSADRSRPVAVRGGSAYASVNASGAHTCAVTAGGEGFCWGYNIDGQLGGGDRENASAPARVLPPSR